MTKTYVNIFKFEIATDNGTYEREVNVFEIVEKRPAFINEYSAYCAAAEYGLTKARENVVNIRLISRCRKLI